MGEAASMARHKLESAIQDEDGGVRTQAIRSFGLNNHLECPDQILLASLRDEEPRVRAATAETLGRRGITLGIEELLPLLEDANDQVKYQVIQSLPRLAGPIPEVLDGLCKRLQEDDSPWIREAAAQALGSLGPAASQAGAALLRAARTGEAVVREQSLRALAMIQPAEAAEALINGLRDASPDVRKVASAGWMKSTEIPDAAVPVLVEALRDPDVQVRANASHALSRLAEIPPEAIPLLLECTADPNDSLRLNAVVAIIKDVSLGREMLDRLLGDPNSRIRLIAAGALLALDSPTKRRQARSRPPFPIRRSA